MASTIVSLDVALEGQESDRSTLQAFGQAYGGVVAELLRPLLFPVDQALDALCPKCGKRSYHVGNLGDPIVEILASAGAQHLEGCSVRPFQPRFL